ncbi:MAG: helix-turn-helix domain-containing protein [Oscillochloridaceae bacterium umkhey_bin13]
MIYQIAETFATLIEQAGLTQAETAAQAGVNRFHLAHVAAGRRNLSGAYAARIASVYAARVGVSQEEAMARLFVVVRQRKSEGPRPRGASGRFVKADGGNDTAG